MITDVLLYHKNLANGIDRGGSEFCIMYIDLKRNFDLTLFYAASYWVQQPFQLSRRVRTCSERGSTPAFVIAWLSYYYYHYYYSSYLPVSQSSL